MTVSDRPPGEVQEQTPNGGATGETATTQPKQVAGLRLPWNIRLDPGSIALSALILSFVIPHFQLWIANPSRLNGLGQVILELVQGTLFLIRRRDYGGRRPPAVWIATMVGSWGFLLARPAAKALFDSPFLFGAQPVFGADAFWLSVQLVGTLLAIVSLSSLGRSFGLLAANRGVRRGGAYRVVRHPAYASYVVVQLGYVLENLSIWNLVVFTVVMAAQLTRIRQEEAMLIQDDAYRSYCNQVHFRLLPGVY